MQLGGGETPAEAYAGEMPTEGRGHGRAAGRVLRARTGVNRRRRRAVKSLRAREGGCTVGIYAPAASAFTYMPPKLPAGNGCGRE